MSLPIIGARREPDISDEGKAADRVFVSTKCPHNLVVLPEFDGLVRGAFISYVSRVGMGKP
jgi:hypothetical protein